MRWELPQKFGISFHDNVYHFILKRVKNEADASDILQDVFVKIHLKKGSLKDESKIQAWIYQISRNAINDFFRVSGRDGDQPVPELEDQDVGFYGKQEMFCCLHPFIEELPEKYKDAIKLADVDGKKQQEVADILNISLSGAQITRSTCPRDPKTPVRRVLQLLHQ